MVAAAGRLIERAASVMERRSGESVLGAAARRRPSSAGCRGRTWQRDGLPAPPRAAPASTAAASPESAELASCQRGSWRWPLM